MKNYGSLTPKNISPEKQEQTPLLGKNTKHIEPDQKTPSHILFQRALVTLVLFRKCPDFKLVASLRSSGCLIAVLLSSNEFKACTSLSKFDYAYIGIEGDKKPSIDYAIKDLSFKGWNKIDCRNMAKPI